MDVELLLVPDCPNHATAAHLLRQALDDLGFTAIRFTTIVVSSPEQAEELAFIRSPTIRIDGVDPFTDPAASPALACRLYRTPAGLSGTPTLPALRQVLKRAADQRADESDATEDACGDR